MSVCVNTLYIAYTVLYDRDCILQICVHIYVWLCVAFEQVVKQTYVKTVNCCIVSYTCLYY